ncbi:MAG: response regulator transcription factor [Bacteroidetes bacterium]|nr:response regulator transcription factor [Bacteroidota bacterium]
MNFKCLIADDEKPARDLLKTYVEQLPQLELVFTCKNGIEVLGALREHQIDIAFLDIQMPQLKGTEVVPLIKEDLPVVVFTTAYDQYALDAFDLEAVDYLLKPFGLDRFIKAVDRAVERVKSLSVPQVGSVSEEEEPFMMVKSEYKLIRVNFSDILYLEAYREYVRIFLEGGDIMTLDTMKNMEATLPETKFKRIHKSYIIAFDKLASIQGNQVEIGANKLPIGRSYKSSLMDALNSGNNHGL